jgi:iron complex outermembrane receptor protein
MARTGHRRHSALLHAGLAALLTAGCAGNPPAQGPAAEEVEVGYGSQRAQDITGSVASLSGERLQAHRAARVEEMFQGRMAGVAVTRLPSGGYSVRIRGAANFQDGGGEPLFVLDGVPLLGARAGHELDGINPADVQRIDVLKDAGSAAIYGSRAANGVILITTRRP